MQILRLLPGVAAAAIIAGVVPGWAGDAALETVGRNDLGGRGLNAALAIGDHCAFVGSRSDDPPLVLDIADPAHPQLAGQLPALSGSTSRELRVAPAERLLVVMYYALGGSGNRLDFYRWEGDCLHPTLAGQYDLGKRKPHEFFLWHDAARAGRVLLFVTTPAARGRNLEVLDVSDPVHPATIGGWDLPPGLGAGANLHSLALSDDGNTGYLALWTGGLLLADVSDFASGLPHPALRLLTPVANALRYPPGNVHSAVPFPGRPLVLLTDEEYPAVGCPYGWARLVDVSNAAQPRLAGILQVPENQLDRCRAALVATWTSHNPTLTAHLALISWYSAGLQVFDVAEPVHPSPLAELRPAGVTPRQRDLRLRGEAPMTWSYPVIRDGLIYVVDINQGLLVLRYRGPYQEEIDGLVFAEGNSNLTRFLPSASPTPPTPTASSSPAVLLSPASSPRPAAARTSGGTVGLLVLGVALLVAGCMMAGMLAVRRLRRR